MSVTKVETKPTPLADAWKEAQDLFYKKTKKRLFATQGQDVDGVLSILERRYAQTPTVDKDESLKAKTKDIAKKVLIGLRVLADFAEPIVNTLYAPAGYCMQAAGFLLEIPEKISEVFAGFTQLFDCIQSFLVQYHILDRIEKNSVLPGELRDNTTKLMISFVRICALCYEPIAGGKFARFKIAVGAALFKYDAGINAELETFERLTKQQLGITGTVTLEELLLTKGLIEKGFENANRRLSVIDSDVRNVGEGVHSLISDSNVRKQEDRNKTIMKDIADRLNTRIPVSDIQKAVDRQTQYIRELIGDRVAETGSWLMDTETEAGKRFAQWRNFESDAPSILGVCGPPNSGKSYLLSAAISKLEEVAGSSRRYVAYYRFDKSDLRAVQERSGRTDVVIEALKCLAFQIAQKSPPFAQELKEVKNLGDPKGPIVSEKCNSYKECWDALRLGSAKVDLNCHFVFDGVDQISDDSKRLELLNLLSKQGVKTRGRYIYVRSLVSGTVESFRGNDELAESIDVHSYSHREVVKFIARELISEGPVKHFQEEHEEMFRTFQTGPIESETDFSVIRSRISRVKQAIEDTIPEDKIKEIMERPLNSEHEVVAQEIINELNENLKSTDIDHLNEVLAWVIYGVRGVTGKIVEQANAARGLITESKYLRQKLSDKGKFARLLEMPDYDEEYIFLRSDELEEILKKTSNDTSTLIEREDDEPKITMNIKITNASRSEVHKFLWNLNQKLAFDQAFLKPAESHVESKATIQVNALDSHSIIIRTCLDILTDDPQEKFAKITDWAAEALPGHLTQALEVENTCGLPVPRRDDIVLGLVSLLSDVQVTKKVFKDRAAISEWFDEPVISAVDTWLRGVGSVYDPVKSLQPRDKRDLKKLVNASSRYTYWYEMTKAIGREWLEDDDWKPYPAYYWISNYVNMIDREQRQDEQDKVDSVVESKVADNETADGNIDGITQVASEKTGEANLEKTADPVDTDLAATQGSNEGVVNVNDELKEEKPGADSTISSCNFVVESNGNSQPDQNANATSTKIADAEDTLAEEKVAAKAESLAGVNVDDVDSTERSSNVKEEQAFGKKLSQPDEDPAELNGTKTVNGEVQKQVKEEDIAEGSEIDSKKDAKEDKSTRSGENVEEESEEEAEGVSKGATQEGEQDGETTPPVGGFVKQEIDKAVEWVRKELKIDVFGVLALRRIADVYSIYGCYKDAIAKYTEALDLAAGISKTREEPLRDITRARRGLAYALCHSDQNAEGVKLMEKVFEAYDAPDDVGPTNDEELRRDHYWFGCTYMWILRDHDHAMHHMKVGAGDLASDISQYLEYLECLWLSKDEQLVAEFIACIKDSMNEDGSSQYLIDITLRAAKSEDPVFLGGSFIPLSRSLNFVEIMAKSVKVLREKIENDNDKTIKTYTAVYLDYYDDFMTILQKPSLEKLEECAGNLARGARRLGGLVQHNRSLLRHRIAIMSTRAYFELMLADPASTERYEKLMDSAIRELHNGWERTGMLETASQLINHLASTGRKEEARALVLNHMKDVFDLLSDDDPENDSYAYSIMGDLLLRVNDDDNAFAAWSLIGPKESTASPEIDVTSAENDTEVAVEATALPSKGPLTEACMGDCNYNPLTYSNDFYICRNCAGHFFCPSCMQKIKDDKLELYTCSNQHDFVHIPAWDPAYRKKVGKDNVHVGGTLQPDTWERIGGEVIPLTTWRDRLREEWGIQAASAPSAQNSEHSESEEETAGAVPATGNED